jgi:hypothetical protein
MVLAEWNCTVALSKQNSQFGSLGNETMDAFLNPDVP